MRTPPGYFEKLYRHSADPWGMASRHYEARKYDLTVASLPEPRYASAFEPGCSIGVLSQRLATRCDSLLVADQAEVAVAAARLRLASFGHVTVEQRSIPEHWPDGPFDLLVLSEVGYYFDEEELGHLVATARGSLRPEADVVAVHWRGTTDYPLTGDRTHALLAEGLSAEPAVHHAEPDFLLDVWRLR